MPAAAPPPRILHLFATFDKADPAAQRTVRLIEALGKKAAHAIVSDDRERRGAASLLPKGAQITWPKVPPIAGRKLPGRLLRLASAMAGYDLICTHGAGTLDAAFAHTLFADVHKLAPLVHHELDPEEAAWNSRTFYRRFALGRSAALIVPTPALEAVALDKWDQPRARIRPIAEGIDTRAFAVPARRDLLPGLVKRRGEWWLGTFADMLGQAGEALVGALADLPGEWQLVIVGEPENRSSLERQAATGAVEDRLHFVSHPASRAALLALFDGAVFPAPGDPHRQAAIEAMAAGLALAAPRDTAAAAPLASDSAPLLFPRGDHRAMVEALRHLATRPDERARIGKANRAKARDRFDNARMVDATWALYSSLIARRPAA